VKKAKEKRKKEKKQMGKMKELNNSMQGQNTSHLHMDLTNRYD
jgi:diadenosine tetraphosphate (Ap4A) HIT family hydrolase